MYELEDAEHETPSKHDSLQAAKDAATARWGSDLFFDGDPDLGATEIYIYSNEEADEPVGYIQIPQEDA